MMRNRKWFFLKDSIDEKKVGIYPQGDGMSKGYDFEVSNSVTQFAEYKGRECDFVPDLRSYILDRKAIVTDSLSGCLGPGGDLTVSSKFYDIIRGFNTGPRQVFSAFVETKGKILEYHRLHFIYTLQSEIDFSESIFTYAGKPLKPKIQSFDEYIDYCENHNAYDMVRAKVTAIRGPKFYDLDLFVIGFYNQSIYVSERLQKSLITAGITGIDIKPVDNLRESREKKPGKTTWAG